MTRVGEALCHFGGKVRHVDRFTSFQCLPQPLINEIVDVVLKSAHEGLTNLW